MSIHRHMQADAAAKAGREIARQAEILRENAAMRNVLDGFDVAWEARSSGDVQLAKRAADMLRRLRNDAAAVAVGMHGCPARAMLSAFLQMAIVAFDLSAESEQRDRAHTAAMWIGQMLRIERGL
jgi:hypothetical protein